MNVYSLKLFNVGGIMSSNIFNFLRNDLIYFHTAGTAIKVMNGGNDHTSCGCNVANR